MRKGAQGYFIYKGILGDYENLLETFWLGNSLRTLAHGGFLQFHTFLVNYSIFKVRKGAQGFSKDKVAITFEREGCLKKLPSQNFQQKIHSMRKISLPTINEGCNDTACRLIEV